MRGASAGCVVGECECECVVNLSVGCGCAVSISVWVRGAPKMGCAYKPGYNIRFLGLFSYTSCY